MKYAHEVCGMSLKKHIRIQRLQNKNNMVGQASHPGHKINCPIPAERICPKCGVYVSARIKEHCGIDYWDMPYDSLY